MEQLTKAQLVLLALLVSFVTSMATGIFTVALMDQAPEPVARTINRIVERTVERVVPAKTETDDHAAETQKIIGKETTIVINEDDLITKAIELNTPKLIRIYQGDPASSTKRVFKGYGVVMEDRLIASDAFLARFTAAPRAKNDTLNSESGLIALIYDEETKKDNEVVIEISDHREKTGIANFRIMTEINRNHASPLIATKDISFVLPPPVILAQPTSVKIGQTIIALFGENQTTADFGRISRIVPLPIPDINEDAPTVTEPVYIEPSFPSTTQGENISPGTPLFNLRGELIALAVHDSKGAMRFVSMK